MVQPAYLQGILSRLGIEATNPSICTGTEWKGTSSNTKAIHSPIDGSLLAHVSMATTADYDALVQKAEEAFLTWRKVPAPKRGELVRQYGNKLRAHKDDLGALVTLEMGKILQEGLGEVQEMIDICDFAVGLSRQLYGLTMQSERADHRMMEQWQPLGIVGIISAFNFPVAVWAWNSMLATICGDVCIWKPSEKTPLTAIACHKLLQDVLKENGVPEGVFGLIIGDAEIGRAMAADTRVPLVSATGSTRMGKSLGATVGARLGKSILELGGNNAVIIAPSADLTMAIRSSVFGSVGTAGQRCTSTRRLIVHESVYDQVIAEFISIYKRLPIGNPLDSSTLIGPIIDKDAVAMFHNALEKVQAEGGKLLFGGQNLTEGELAKGNYVMPAIVEAENHYEMVQHETFAPILYIIKYSGDVYEAIAIQNGVKQGLSSSIFTLNMREAEIFVSQAGSDCGIANVNIGTSGAEIGGAFGGEKETGGGRESGTDSWRAYMRRQTNTINYGDTLPLAQGIKFDV